IHFALVIAAYAARRKAKENDAHEASETNVSSAHDTSPHSVTEKT
ncbi:12721_t:CDS:1, partial [Racocetra fulgida]